MLLCVVATRADVQVARCFTALIQGRSCATARARSNVCRGSQPRSCLRSRAVRLRSAKGVLAVLAARADAAPVASSSSGDGVFCLVCL